MSKSRDPPSTPIGKGHLAAMGRLGLAELRGAFFNESNIAQPPQVGLYGMPSQGEIAEARREDDHELEEVQKLNEEPRSILDERLDAVNEAREVREPDETKKIDRE